MTEAEWMACDDPKRMLAFLHKRGGERKRRHFAAACGRRGWHLLQDERSRRALEIAELYADGLASAEELSEAEGVADEAHQAAKESGPPRTSSTPPPSRGPAGTWRGRRPAARRGPPLPTWPSAGGPPTSRSSAASSATPSVPS